MFELLACLRQRPGSLDCTVLDRNYAQVRREYFFGRNRGRASEEARYKRGCASEKALSPERRGIPDACVSHVPPPPTRLKIAGQGLRSRLPG